MKTFKYFGTTEWPQHMQVQTEQMQYLAHVLSDSGKIPQQPDVKQMGEHELRADALKGAGGAP